jgi:RNA polymerase sigma-70 factor (ECF subfamily)
MLPPPCLRGGGAGGAGYRESGNLSLAASCNPGDMMALAMTAPLSTELDRATLDRARALDPVALRAFVVRYERPVFALLSRMLGRGPHVEDLAQETFLRAFRALPAFRLDGPARASTWLLTIATRLALDSRKKKRFPLAEPEAAHQVPDASTPETERARRELGGRLAKAAEALSDDHRAALLLSDVHGFTLAEVGEALGIPEPTAKTRVFRARQHMREALPDLREGVSRESRDLGTEKE